MKASARGNLNSKQSLNLSITPKVLGLVSSTMSTHGAPHSGAMELSHNKIGRINVLDLPMDILHNIFDHFQGAYITVQGKVKSIHHRPKDDSTNHCQTIQSARLVCRLFHQLTSPLLCPVLQVRLDQTSLDLLNDISRSPLIAAGVRSVQVVLDYRPKELAADLSRFKDHRKKDLNKISRKCEWHEESLYLGGGGKYMSRMHPLREYRKAIDYYWSICLAWDDCFSPANGNAKYADSLDYQRVLRQCHEEYRQKHEEQLQLITDGSFVNILASSMSQMAHCSSLHFVDKIDRYLDPYMRNPTLLLNNIEELSRFMVTPQDWRTIEELEGGAELVPAKILSELLIAIHKAGTTLREIHVNCFPVTSNCSMVCPDRQDRLNPAWANLSAACQHLEKFEFGGDSMSERPVQYNHLLAEEQTFIDKYLGAILSGQSLEVVDLNFWAFGWYRIGSLLGATKWSSIKQARISDVSLDQGELEKFCSGLGYRLELISLYSIELLSGSWAGALYILREKVSSRCLEMKCRVEFMGLTGGEFGKERKRDVYTWWDRMDFNPNRSVREEPLIVMRSQKYVSGVEVEENPLKGNGSYSMPQVDGTS
jgi:hypothetical protein